MISSNRKPYNHFVSVDPRSVLRQSGRGMLLVFVIVFGLFLVQPIHAESAISWQESHGPYGGVIQALAMHPTDHSLLLAGTAGGLFVSQDAGMSWGRVSIADSGCVAVSQIAYLGEAEPACYVATCQGVYVASNDLDDWHQLFKGAPIGPVDQIVAAPSGDCLYAAFSDALYVLPAGADTWTLAGQLPPGTSAVALVVSADDSGLVYLGSKQGAFVSYDAGGSWKQFLGLPSGLAVNDLALSMGDRTVYVATDQGLYLSRSRGQVWSSLSSEPCDLLYVPTDSATTVYANLGLRGLFVSHDAGDQFSVYYYPARPGRIWDMAISLSEGGYAYLGTDYGVHLTRNGGDAWQSSNRGLVGSAIEQLVDVPGDRGHLYALVQGDLFATFDAGGHWSKMPRGAFAAPLIRLALGYGNRDLYALTEDGDLLCAGHGPSEWSQRQVPKEDVHFTIIEPVRVGRSGGDALLIGTERALWITLDGAESWARLDTSSFTQPIQAITCLGDTLYAAVNRRIFALSDLGDGGSLSAWQCITEEPLHGSVIGLASTTKGRDQLFAITDSARLYRTHPVNWRWEDLTGSSLHGRQLWAVSLVPRAFRDTAVVLLTDSGTLLSFDGGETLVEGDGACLEAGSATSLLYDDSAPRDIYVGTSRQSVCRGRLQEADLYLWVVYGGASIAGMVLLYLVRYLALSIARQQSRPSLLDTEWSAWDSQITHALSANSYVVEEMLHEIPTLARLVTMRRYIDSHPELALKLVDAPVPALMPIREPELKAFREYWGALRNRIDNPDGARTYALYLTEQLCDLMAFEPVESKPYQFLQGYMLRASTMRLNLPSEFPIIFSLKSSLGRGDTRHIRDLMRAMNVTSFFAIIVVDSDESGLTGAALSRLISTGAEDFIVLDMQDLANLYLAADPTQALMQLILEQIDLVSICPYIIAGPVPDSMFFGRDYETKAIMRTIRDRSYAIVGGRKIGKTSVLTKVNRLLEQSVGYAPVYVDCQHVANHHAFFETLESIEHVFAGARTPDYMRRVVVHLRQRYHGATLVFLMDEVDDLLAFDVAHGTRLFKVFRALSQEGVCRFVFCGQRTLSEALHDPESPLFNFCSDMRLGYLQPSDTMRIITEPMAELEITYQDRELLPQQIIDLSSCHPNLVQIICRQLVERLNERGDRTITAADLDYIRQSEAFRDYFFEVTWGNTTVLERLITLLAADEPSVTQDELAEMLAAENCEVTTRELVRALDTLLLLAVFRREENRYLFAARYFPRLIKHLGFDAMFRDSWIRECRRGEQGDSDGL